MKAEGGRRLDRWRWLFLCSASVLLCTNGAQAGTGAYLRTKENKAIVWDPDAKHEDAASWSGDRDRWSYAIGYGTVTWYRIERKFGLGSRMPLEKYIPVMRYTGNMVKGKLDGLVVAVDAEGKTSHATFANGARSDEWADGPGPAPKEPLEKQQGAVAEAPAKEPLPAASPIHEHPPLPGSGATGPAEQDVAKHEAADVSSQKLSSNVQLPTSVRPPDQPVNKRVTERAAAQRPEEILSPEPTPIPANLHLAQQPSVDVPAKASPLTVALPSAAPSPVVDRPVDQNISHRPAVRSRVQADDFLRSLAIPPSTLAQVMTLRDKERASSQPSVAATSPPPPAASPPPPVRPRLSTADVMGLADAEARIQGYELGGYQCSKVDYTVANDTWLVLYDEKPVDGKADASKHFSVTIEDKTKKASIAPGK